MIIAYRIFYVNENKSTALKVFGDFGEAATIVKNGNKAVVAEQLYIRESVHLPLDPVNIGNNTEESNYAVKVNYRKDVIKILNPYKGGDFRITSVYGKRILNGKNEFHSGLDIVGESSKDLLALCDGEIIQSRIVTDRSNLTWQWGNYVTLKADTGELIIYAHLSKRLVNKGDRVKKGDVIGIEGNTGYSFGSHCHLEVRNSNNRVTDKTNTPRFTGIPNKTGKYTVKEAESLTKDETQALINSSKERVWHYWSEIEKEASWAYKPLWALYSKGLFKGEPASDLNISQTKLELLVVMARGFKELGLIDY